MRETALQRARSVQKEGERGAPGTEGEIPLQPVLKTMMRKDVPLQSVEVHVGADMRLQPVEEPHAGATEWKNHSGKGLLAGLATLQGIHAGAVCSGMTASCGNKSHTKAIPGGLAAIGGTCTGEGEEGEEEAPRKMN